MEVETQPNDGGIRGEIKGEAAGGTGGGDGGFGGVNGRTGGRGGGILEGFRGPDPPRSSGNEKPPSHTPGNPETGSQAPEPGRQNNLSLRWPASSDDPQSSAGSLPSPVYLNPACRRQRERVCVTPTDCC